MKKKIIIISAIVVVLLGGFGILKMSKSKKVAASLWETVTVQKGDLSVTVDATGELKPVLTVEVGTQVSGVIAELRADYNSRVKKGDIIAQLDTRTLKAQTAEARAMLEKSQVALRQCERDFNRMKALFEQSAVAQVDYDNALDAYETAKANLVSAEVAYDRAQVNLNYGTIRAPIDGVIISKSVEPGQTVAASFSTPTLFKIANDLTKMKIEASIDEADIGMVKLGQRVVFNVDAFTDQSFEGKVNQIRLEPTTVSNVVTYTVVIEVANPDLKLMPGMTANLTIYVEDQKDVLKIAQRAFSFAPSMNMLMKYGRVPEPFRNMKKGAMPTASGGQMPAMPTGSMPAMGNGSGFSMPKDMGQLWLLKNDSLVLAMVKKGVTDGQYYEIRGMNLKEGDTVVVASNIVEEETATGNQGPPNPFMPTRRRN